VGQVGLQFCELITHSLFWPKIKLLYREFPDSSKPRMAIFGRTVWRVLFASGQARWHTPLTHLNTL
jgi:hypothetical protein